ncbi:MAG: hypothetical protein ABI580_07525, partial [Burkholderiaceae bacterium]
VVGALAALTVTGHATLNARLQRVDLLESRHGLVLRTDRRRSGKQNQYRHATASNSHGNGDLRRLSRKYANQARLHMQQNSRLRMSYALAIAVFIGAASAGRCVLPHTQHRQSAEQKGSVSQFKMSTGMA